MKSLFAIAAACFVLGLGACGDDSSSNGSVNDDGTFTDSRDGKKYKIAKIGNQVWMAENLNYDYTNLTTSGQVMSHCYDNDPANCEKYGRLYMWTAAIDSASLATDKENPQQCGYGSKCEMPKFVQGICPDGWHLPSKDEWDELLEFVGGWKTASSVLRSKSGWDDGKNGTDDFGFNGLPAGYRSNATRNRDVYGGVGISGSFWSSTPDDEHSANYAFDASLQAAEEYVFMYNSSKDLGFSVRCVKN